MMFPFIIVVHICSMLQVISIHARCNKSTYDVEPCILIINFHLLDCIVLLRKFFMDIHKEKHDIFIINPFMYVKIKQ